MADLNFPQSADPVCIFNDSSQNQMAVNADGSTSTRQLDSNGNSITNGQKTMANSTPVVIASDQTAIPVTQATTPWTVVQTSVNTYIASTSGSAITTTTPQDVFTITGSASKTIKIIRMGMSMTQTTAATVSASLIKRAANSAGTSTTIANIPFDSNNAAATATVRQYTANPTPGAAAGFFMAKRVFIPTATGVFNSLVEWDFSTTESTQRPTLRGTNETMAINLGGTTVTGANPSFYVEWTEE